MAADFFCRWGSSPGRVRVKCRDVIRRGVYGVNDRIGIRPFINCCGTRTVHGGTLMLPRTDGLSADGVHPNELGYADIAWGIIDNLPHLRERIEDGK